MTWVASTPRLRRSLVEWLTLTGIAPVAARWRNVARLRGAFAALFTQPGQRLYQLPYLAAGKQAAFRAALAAGKLRSTGLLGKLRWGNDELGGVVLGEVVAVYWLAAASPRRSYGTVLLLTGQGVADSVAVPSRLLLWLLLLGSKTILQ